MQYGSNYKFTFICYVLQLTQHKLFSILLAMKNENV